MLSKLPHFLFCFMFFFASNAAVARDHRSEIPASIRYLDSSQVVSIKSENDLGGFNKLIPYVLASPDQEEAGSCLYMAITGIAEWHLARLNPEISRIHNGPLDLSERYSMNLAGVDEASSGVNDWRTDSIYLFNLHKQESILNQTYPFTKGWFVEDAHGDLVPAKSTTPGARYDTYYNWIDQHPKGSEGRVKLPKFKREVLFRDPEHNQWNIGAAPDSLVETIKTALKTKKAPVLVIYNHYLYWHAVYIIGYNDEMSNGNCSYTQNFRSVMTKKVEELQKKIAASTNAEEKEELKAELKKIASSKDAIDKVYADRGGCSSKKGVFYIRDSIYPDPEGPIYDYDPTREGEEAPYTKRIVMKEYDWVRYFVNHAVVITTDEN